MDKNETHPVKMHSIESLVQRYKHQVVRIHQLQSPPPCAAGLSLETERLRTSQALPLPSSPCGTHLRLRSLQGSQAPMVRVDMGFARAGITPD